MFHVNDGYARDIITQSRLVSLRRTLRALHEEAQIIEAEDGDGDTPWNDELCKLSLDLDRAQRRCRAIAIAITKEYEA